MLFLVDRRRVNSPVRQHLFAMKQAVFLIVVVIMSSGSVASQKPSCTCKMVGSDAITRSGGNEWVAYRQTGILKLIRGNVAMPLAELSDNVLVEVFDQPDYLICEWRDKNPNNCTTTPPANQRRIAACVTGKDGAFCFSNLPAGKYELRVSKGAEWSPTHVLVTVNPGRGTSKPIEVHLNLGF